MKHIEVAKAFLRWLANHPEVDDWETALEWYLKVNTIPYEKSDLKQLKRIIREAFKKLSEN